MANRMIRLPGDQIKKSFTVNRNSDFIKIESGKDAEVPEVYLQNLKTEGVIPKGFTTKPPKKKG